MNLPANLIDSLMKRTWKNFDKLEKGEIFNRNIYLNAFRVPSHKISSKNLQYSQRHQPSSQSAINECTKHKSECSYNGETWTLGCGRRRRSWDRAEHSRVRRGTCCRTVGGWNRPISTNKNVELLRFLAVTRFSTCEIKSPRWSNVE